MLESKRCTFRKIGVGSEYSALISQFIPKVYRISGRRIAVPCSAIIAPLESEKAAKTKRNAPRPLRRLCLGMARERSVCPDMRGNAFAA